ncbi:MAG: PIG-L deacetylase family protein [Methanomassiliicoccales archaeon]
MFMDWSKVSLELRLIALRISRRFWLRGSLSGSAWNPKSMESIEGRRIMVISPHPDDDAIGCGGLIIKAISQGKNVKIVYLSLPKIHASSLKERELEAIKSMEVMGVTDFYLPKKEFPKSKKEVSRIIAKCIDEYGPDLVLVPSPWENHDQHLLSFEAYLDLLKEDLEVDTCMYEVWGMLIPNLVVNITEEWKRKAEAISAHASQLSKVDYVAMADALNSYRAISSGLRGRAEAFLQLNKKDVISFFSKA